jgi:hypothetical protein
MDAKFTVYSNTLRVEAVKLQILPVFTDFHEKS